MSGCQLTKLANNHQWGMILIVGKLSRLEQIFFRVGIAAKNEN